MDKEWDGMGHTWTWTARLLLASSQARICSGLDMPLGADLTLRRRRSPRLFKTTLGQEEGSTEGSIVLRR